ncbi:hypothetical protein ARSEF4850_009975 [Beauveria asiatica]
MDFDTICVWVSEVIKLTQPTQTDDHAAQQIQQPQQQQQRQQAHPLRRPLDDRMSSPPKRQRISEDDAPVDPDETPRRIRSQPDNENDDVFTAPAHPVPQSAASATSSFAAQLVASPVFSAAATQQHATTSVTSRTTASSRSSSPSKRALRLPSLLDLVIPVRFTSTPLLAHAIPSDAKGLFESLSRVAAKVGILPAALQDHPDFVGSFVQPFMWSPAGAADESQTALRNHEQLRDITAESTTSLDLLRSEAAWNCRVHTSFLKFALRHADGVDFEPITSAHIMPSFRPRFRTNKGAAASTRSSSSAASEYDSPSQNRPSAHASSAHKMVDFALVLEPDQALRAIISDFLDGQDYATSSINQTRYEPLRERPAPIFMETKVLPGNAESARVQLGIWIAAWHERMRSIIALGGNAKRVITVPLIHAFSGHWIAFFVVDEGTGILDAAMATLASWAKDTFEPVRTIWYTPRGFDVLPMSTYMGRERVPGVLQATTRSIRRSAPPDAIPFGTLFWNTIGLYITVMFNTDRTKEMRLWAPLINPHRYKADTFKFSLFRPS